MRRIVELDAMRGLVALSIVIYHLHPEQLAFLGMRVDFFLILSGYVVTALILRKGDCPGFLPTFYIRRVIRIWPCYFAALLALVLVNPLLPKPFPLDGLPYYLTFTQNLPYYWSDAVPAFNWYFLHTWTLALLEQFYLIWPVLVLRAGPGRIVPLGLAIAAGSAIARGWGVHPWLLVARCDGLALGGVLAAIMASPARERRPRTLRVAFLAAIALSLSYAAAGVSFGSTRFLWPSPAWPGLSMLACNILYFGIVGTVAMHGGGPRLAPLRHRRLLQLGAVSYGLYLYHPMVIAPIHIVARKVGLGTPLWLDALCVAACIGVAVAAWHLLERPLQRLKDRFAFRPSAAPESGRDPILEPAVP